MPFFLFISDIKFESCLQCPVGRPLDASPERPFTLNEFDTLRLKGIFIPPMLPLLAELGGEAFRRYDGVTVGGPDSIISPMAKRSAVLVAIFTNVFQYSEINPCSILSNINKCRYWDIFWISISPIFIIVLN
jgi:hypothetical protein